MYSGLLPKGLTEDDLSPNDEEDEQEDGVEERREGEKLSSVGENTQSTNAASDADSDSPTCGIPGISQEMWQKFQDLRQKKDEMKTVKIPRKRKRRRHKKAGTESEEPTQTREHQEEREKHWDELKQYFGVNDRFHPPACSKPPPKSGLEKSIERAIAEGDIAKAEEMSDRLATRELAVNIAQAADCRDFVQRKQEEEALREAQKRRKDIAWGFEAKRRWETKSNMGFM
ncbi:protein FAM204A isoform X2 [Dicentrarchus labrax]|uniref:protein FAM204A isoform X2 n=1 Tax=Dicentrarchus labrax TaxID=13489 RepID=UPI001637A998|nr:protein FAM204A isoform X2 [Dicentrarchus labrax]